MRARTSDFVFLNWKAACTYRKTAGAGLSRPLLRQWRPAGWRGFRALHPHSGWCFYPCRLSHTGHLSSRLKAGWAQDKLFPPHLNNEGTHTNKQLKRYPGCSLSLNGHTYQSMHRAGFARCALHTDAATHSWWRVVRMARWWMTWVWSILYCLGCVLNKLVLLVVRHIPQQLDQLWNDSRWPFFMRIVCFMSFTSAKKIIANGVNPCFLTSNDSFSFQRFLAAMPGKNNKKVIYVLVDCGCGGTTLHVNPLFIETQIIWAVTVIFCVNGFSW